MVGVCQGTVSVPRWRRYIGMVMEMGQHTLRGVTPVEVKDEDPTYRRMCPNVGR